MLEKHFYLIARLYLIILLDDDIIDPNMTRFGRLLNFVSGGIFNKIH